MRGEETTFPSLSLSLIIKLFFSIPSIFKNITTYIGDLTGKRCYCRNNFSTLSRIKTWLHSRMAEDRLSNLSLINAHGEIDMYNYKDES